MPSDKLGDAILHGFADHGAECEVLQQFGTVTRATINPRDYLHSHVIEADLSRPDELPFAEDQFALGVFHPPCTAWSDMPGANKDDDAPRLIEEAREIGERYCEHYVIENKPAAPLENPTVLSGKMFGLPIRYERAFESSFDLPQPPRQASLGVETSSFFYSERSTEWWCAVKGVPPGRYPKEHVAKNTIPMPYIRYITRRWLESTGTADGVTDYSDYDARMDEKRAREANHQLGGFANAE